MQTISTIILSVLAALSVGALIVGYVVWRERRRAEDQRQRDETARAWGETDPDDPSKQTQRPIWRPGSK